MGKSKLAKWAFVLSASMLLASCGKVEVSLTNAEENANVLIKEDATKDDIYNNDMKPIYESLVTSGYTNSEKVLNNLLQKIADNKFGSFYDDGDAKGLYHLVHGGTNEEILSFVSAHEVFKGDNEDESIQKVKDFEGMLEKTIKKSFFSTVKNSTYQERSWFVEGLFYKAENAAFYDFSAVRADSSIEEGILAQRSQVHGQDTEDDVEKYFFSKDGKTYIDFYQDYIQRSILDAAYRKALVEQYLFDQNYGVLGRSYARKVQYVAIKDEQKGDHLGSLYRLFHAYAINILEKSTGDIDTEAGVVLTSDEANEIRDLHFLDLLYLGYFDDAFSDNVKKVADYVYGKANFTAVEANADNGTKATYEETKYGQLVLDYGKRSENRWKSSESSTDFTASNAYTNETGLERETHAIIASTNVTEGWYTDTGLSSMASSFKTRLFKMNVANELDTAVLNGDGTAIDASAYYVDGNNGSRHDGDYTTRIKADGRYYLMPETYDSSSDAPYLLYDSGSTTWYIVRVDEAVKANKLLVGGENYYANLAKVPGLRSGSETVSEICWEIADLLGDSDTYKKAANQYYVDNAALAYHDQDVYDYFKKTFPDLFD